MGPLSVNALHYDRVMSAKCLVEVEPSSLDMGNGDETADTGQTSGAIFRVFRHSTTTAVSECLCVVMRQEDPHPYNIHLMKYSVVFV